VTGKENGLKKDRETALCSEKISREELLVKASELVRILHHRTTTRRFKAGQHDRPRLAYARVAVAAVTAYAGILKDAELVELEKRIERLEQIEERK
jgi:hypothetical protein